MDPVYINIGIEQELYDAILDRGTAANRSIHDEIVGVLLGDLPTFAGPNRGLINPDGHGKGLLRQPVDDRDLVLAIPEGTPLPAGVDLRTSPFRPPIWNQGSLGSCTAFATARIAEQTYGIDGFHNPFDPSKLFLYYNARNLEKSTGSDAGATMRDAMKALAIWGICAEHWWPYSDATPGPFSATPPSAAYLNAGKHLATKYHAVPLTLASMKGCLASGYPFMTGILVYASFESSTGGIIPLPDVASEPLLGGHAITVQGYEDAKELFICDNSWGPSWGDAGSFYLPYAYLTDPDLAYDAWTLLVQR